jgi:hypothetical protein
MSTTVSAVREHTSRAQPEARSWSLFRRNLAAVLASLENDQPLIISSKRGNRFVQFVRDVSSEGVPQLRAEAVSNKYLSGPRRLTRKQIAALPELGWSAPTHGDGKPAVPHGSPNFYRDFEGRLPFGEIARIAVRTLTEVFRIAHTEDLEYRSFQDPGGKEVILPSLGISRVRPRAPREQTYREARAAVLRAIREASGQNDLEMNDEGRITVQRGDVLLHVHVVETPRFVRVCTPVLRDVTLDEAVLRRLNELNQGATLVRVLASDSAIWVSADVFAHPLVPRHVVHACGVVADLASELSVALESEFGQRSLFPKIASAGLKN